MSEALAQIGLQLSSEPPATLLVPPWEVH